MEKLLHQAKSKNLKKILSLILIFALTMGTVNFGSINAMAATGDPSVVNFEQDGITGSKSVVNNGNGTVDITFTVTGADKEIPIPQVKDTNIVLVMDVSGSMEEGNRISKAKEAAKRLVDQILTNANKEHVKIGIASFNKTGHIKQHLTNNATTVKTAINGLNANGGTNIQAGIQEAQSILAEDTRTNVNNIIIILSDGEPTYSYHATVVAANDTVLNDGSAIKMLTTFNSSINGTGSDYTFDAYRIGGIKVTRTRPLFGNWSSWKDSSGTSYANDKVSFVDSNFLNTEQSGYVNATSVSNNGYPTISQAYLAKNNNITIYSIAYDISNNANAVYTMKNVASSLDRYYEASSTASGSDTTSNAIANIMNSITEEVNETIAAARGATIVDKLPSYLTATAVIASEGTTAVIDNSQQVTWTIGELPALITKSLTIRASLNKGTMLSANNKTESDLINGLWFDMNKEATFTYTKADNQQGSVRIGNPKLQFFTQKYTINYYEDGTKIDTRTKYQFIGDSARFGNIPAYDNDTVKYNKSLTQASSNDVTLSPDSGNWSFTMPQNAVEIRVDYHKNEFTVNYYDNQSSDNNGKGTLLSTQSVRYGENATPPSTDGLEYLRDGYEHTFSNWNKDGQNITANTDILAQYNSQKIKYIAEFFANTGDATPVETQNIEMNTEGKFLVNVSNVIPVYNGPLAEDVARMEFDGWDFDFTTSITGNVQIYAKYQPVYKTFTVQFHDMDDAKTVIPELTIHNVAYASPVTAPSYSKGDLHIGNEVRIFTGWTNESGNIIDLSSIKANTDVYASYRTVPRYYTVTWDAKNGLESDNQVRTVEYGSSDSWVGNNPTKTDSSGEYTYSFIGWDNQSNGTVTNVTSDMIITALYDEVKNRYSYNFEYLVANEDGSDVRTNITIPETVDWGTTLSEPADFERQIVVTVSGSGIWTTYSFNEWSNEDFINGIKSNGTAKASYDLSKTYLVTFVAEDGTVVKTLKVKDGETVPASDVPNVPEKAADDTYTYQDPTWGDVSKIITEPTVFRASYTPVFKDYTINVNLYLDGTEVETLATLGGHFNDDVTGDYTAIVDGLSRDGKKYIYSKIVGADLSGATYTRKISGNGEINIYFVEEPKFEITYYKTFMVAPVEGSLELVPQRSTIVIGTSEKVYAGEPIVETFTYDGTVDAASFNNAKYTYTFVGWVDAEGNPFTDTTVTENKNVYASFKATINTYTVTFLDYTNEPDVAASERDYSVEVFTKTVEYGTTITIPAVPTRNDTEKYHYTAHTWNIAESAINPVTNNLVVKAEHSYELKKYEITFIDYDGTVLKKETAEYDATVAAPTEPTRPDSEDGHYYYTFDKWVEIITNDGEPTTGDALNSSSVRVSRNAIYQAVYTEKEHTFKVTFLNADGTYFGTQPYQAEVTWGQMVKNETKDAARALADNAATQMSNALITYTFARWETKELIDNVETKNDATLKLNEAITKDLTVYASYLDVAKVYTITYMDENGTEIASVKVTAGESYVVSQSGPAKESTNTKVFTFSHWVERFIGENETEMEQRISEIDSVDRDYVLYPVYEESTRYYKVDFMDHDGRSLAETQYVEYEESATAPRNPSRPDVNTGTTRTVYTFTGWDVDFTKIKADTTVTARYRATTYDTSTPTPTPVPSTPTPVPPTPTPVQPTPEVEDIPDPEIPEGTPEVEEIIEEDNEIPEGTPMVDTEDELSKEDTSAEVIDEEIPQATPTLPKTGTAPVGIFYGLGAACAYIGASIIISNRKKKEEECE